MRQYSLPAVFSQGFALATKSLDIFFVGLVLSLPSLISSSMQDAFLGRVFQIANLILLIIDTGFMLSIPIFFVKKQQNKVLHYKELWSVVFKNTKRIILPGILLSILFVTILVTSFVFVISAFDLSTQQIGYFFGNAGSSVGIIPIVFMTLVSFFEFTSFFFSLENNSLLQSIKKSIGVAFHNIPYIGIIIFINITSYMFSSFFLSEGLWRQCISMVVGGYIAFVLSASSLVYYQRIVKR